MDNGLRRLIIASQNAHKIREFQEILGSEFSVAGIAAIDCHVEWVEDGTTFQDNALIKAKAVRAKTSSCVLADDSGLSVEALAGAPGVYSSRYAGPAATDSDNVRKLLNAMQQVEPKKRNAAFVCHLAFVDENNRETHFTGMLKGRITASAAGKNGFGYDPIFQPEGFQKTLAELEDNEKNKISHRRQAIDQWLAFMKTVKVD